MTTSSEPQGGGSSSCAGAARRTVAFFGGSFNPPHISHVLAAVYALSIAPIDEVLVVPVYRHPFAKELAGFDDRLEMCRLSLGWIPRVSVSDVERELGGESLTLRTLEHLRASHPEWSLRLLVGADVLADLPKWHRFDRIAELAPPIVLGRAGVQPPSGRGAGGASTVPGRPHDAPEPLLPRVSSTEIRYALAGGDVEAVRPLVPASVVAYILERGLYRRSL